MFILYWLFMIIFFYYKTSYKNSTVFVKSYILIIIQVIKNGTVFVNNYILITYNTSTSYWKILKNGTVYQTIIEYKNIEMVSQKLYKIKHIL